MKKAPPQLHPDLAAVIREVLERSPVPLNVAKLRALLPGPYKVPAKLKNDLVALLQAFHQWPGDRYWVRDGRAWAEPVMLAAAEMPVPASKAVSAVSKVYGKPAAEVLLTELLAKGLLMRVPLFGGVKAKVCSKIADEGAFRAELDAARAVIEAGYRRLDGGFIPLPDGRGSDDAGTGAGEKAGAGAEKSVGAETAAAEAADDQILETIATLEPQKGLLVTAARLYRALPGIPKEEIDAALIRLQDARRVILQRHSNPQQTATDLIAGLYAGACWRNQE